MHRTRSLAVGDVLSDTVAVIGRAPGAVLAHGLVAAVVLVLLRVLETTFEYPEAPFLTLALSQAVLYLQIVTFVLAQAFATGGVGRVLRGGAFDLSASYRGALRLPGRLVGTALTAALIVWAWSLLCGIAALLGMRSTYVALPHAVAHPEDPSSPISVSSRWMSPHLGPVAALTALFLVPYFLGEAAGLYAIRVLAASSEFDADPSPSAGWVGRLVPVSLGLLEGLLFAVWSVVTCAAYFRLAGGAHETLEANEELVDVF